MVGYPETTKRVRQLLIGPLSTLQYHRVKTKLDDERRRCHIQTDSCATPPSAAHGCQKQYAKENTHKGPGSERERQ